MLSVAVRRARFAVPKVSAAAALGRGPWAVMSVRSFCAAAAATAPAEVPEGALPEDRQTRQAMLPNEMVDYLDQYIVGQKDAKKAVANALRNRWRRQQLDEEMRQEIMPRNILMVGPTGVGKTEVARRLAKLVDAPFIKVEATKFTEVGYHGKDVDTIIKDLVELAIRRQRSRLEAEFAPEVNTRVEEQILTALLGRTTEQHEKDSWLKHLRSGALDERFVSIDVPNEPRMDEILAPGGDQGVKMVKVSPNTGKPEKKKVTVKEAKKRLRQGALDKLISQELVTKKAIEAVEQEGVVFIDEIDKICQARGARYSGDASAEGVQRDLLPIIEGCEIATKHGNVKTDHILFICSGAFSAVKPSDMLAELQGRLPVRVELKALTKEDFERILTEPKHNVIMQNQALLGTEGIRLTVGAESVSELARVSSDINTYVENIGARRLHTVLEKLMEEISFDAPTMPEEKKTIEVTPDMVRTSIEPLLKKTDLSKFIL